jgi:hypothetical protein
LKKGAPKTFVILYLMALEVTLGNFNVMPVQAGIHDFL